MGHAASPVVDVPPIQVAIAKKLLAIPEEQVDVARAGLIISTLFDPTTDVDDGLRVVDAIAARVKTLLAGRTDPDTRIRALNTALFQESGFAYDSSDPMGRNVENKYLWGLLKRKKGNCVMLPVLWLAVAHRLGYPVRAVDAPQHMFLRYEEGTFRQNIEATSGGGTFSDEKIIRELKIPNEAIASGNMMRSMSRREVVMHLVLQLASIHLARNDLGIAGDIYMMVNDLYPRDMSSHFNIAVILTKEAAALTAIKLTTPARMAKAREMVAVKARLALSHARQATALGAVPPLEDGYWIPKSTQAVEQAPGTEAPKPFVLEDHLTPAGFPIVVDDRMGVLPSYGSARRNFQMLPGEVMGECAQMCGPSPGNLCAELAKRFR